MFYTIKDATAVTAKRKWDNVCDILLLHVSLLGLIFRVHLISTSAPNIMSHRDIVGMFTKK